MGVCLVRFWSVLFLTHCVGYRGHDGGEDWHQEIGVLCFFLSLAFPRASLINRREIVKGGLRREEHLTTNVYWSLVIGFWSLSCVFFPSVHAVI